MLSNQDKGQRVKQVYSELNRKFEEEETARHADEQGIGYINLYGFPVDAQALSLIPQSQAQQFGAAVFFKEGHLIKLGSTNPLAKIQTLVKQLIDEHFTVEVYLISQSSFNHLTEAYGKILSTDRHSEKIEIT